MRLLDATEQQGAGLVFVGNLNPSIFNPDWLSNREIISANEAASATVAAILSDFANFKTGDLIWEITDEKFSVISESEPFVRLADIAMGVFANSLPETPLKAGGVNWYHHFRLPSRQHQINLGRELAPIAPFGEWGRGLDDEDPIKVGGLRSLSMQRLHPEFDFLGRAFKQSTTVTVEPSLRIKEGYGVYVSVNHHFQLVSEDGKSGPLVELINQKLNDCISDSLEIVSSLYEFGVRNG